MLKSGRRKNPSREVAHHCFASEAKIINVFTEYFSSTIFPYFSWLYAVCYSQKCRGNVKNILKGEANLRSSFPYCLKRLCLCWQNEIDMYIFSRLSIFFPFPLLIKSEIHTYIVSDRVYQPETRVLFRFLEVIQCWREKWNKSIVFK